MNDEFNKKVLLIASGVGVLGIIIAAAMPGELADNAYLVGRFFAVGIIVFTLIYLLILPNLYKKKLEEKGAKNLRTLVMMDPRFRDAMTKRAKVQNWQGDETANQKSKSEPAPPNPGHPDAKA